MYNAQRVLMTSEQQERVSGLGVTLFGLLSSVEKCLCMRNCPGLRRCSRHINSHLASSN